MKAGSTGGTTKPKGAAVPRDLLFYEPRESHIRAQGMAYHSNLNAFPFSLETSRLTT